MAAMADEDCLRGSFHLGSDSSRTIKPWSTRKSSSKPSSPWLSPLRQRQLIQPVSSTRVWDVEFPRSSSSPSRRQSQDPRSRERVKLRRSLSLLERPTPPPQPCSSVRRSLWSGESKHALQMRLGVYLDAMPEEPIIASSSASDLEEDLLLRHGDCKDDDDRGEKKQSPSSSSDQEAASSIFSSKKSSSFSSTSDGGTATSSNRAQEREEVEEQGGFLDYTLVRGQLVLPEVDDGDKEEDNRPPWPASPLPPVQAMADRYPAWALMRSLTEKKKKTMIHEEDSERRRHVARRLLFTSSPSEQQPRPSSRFFSPSPRKERSDGGGGDLLKALLDALPRALIRKRSSSGGSSSAGSNSGNSSSSAHLHCAIRHDHHSYTYLVDGSEERLVARVPRPREQHDRGEKEDEQPQGQEEEVCSFFSWKRSSSRAKARSSWRPAWASPSAGDSRPQESSELVANMRLRRSPSSIAELQFVLSDVCERSLALEQRQGDQSIDHRLSFSSWQSSSLSSASSSSNPSKSSTRITKKKSLSHNSSPTRGKIADDDDQELDILREVWKQMEADERSRAAKKRMNPLQELAAIVVTLPGLATNHHHLKSSSHSRNPSVESLPDHGFAAMSVTAVLPVGEHGLPDRPNSDGGDRDSSSSGGAGGPSSLIQRWRRGKCDCGGWDLGCALHTLGRNPDARSPLSSKLDISLQIQGGRGQIDRDCFELVGLSNGLFSVKFKEPLSALQAFATAVAIIHASRVNTGQDLWSAGSNISMLSRCPPLEEL
ncbi:uncharacterized protein LOC112342306 [Selaginella moellendorffii]|uniref:uncharacterized protein LOC112342306 n=1 Tax=Selaginella moellendorffii TaxID=88036 RepID=UPI000D1D00FF|nr:uncharacterized protein LOC112342306 [Selaginella moellendorffii]|eukprot:XP_024519683.1 uncharacterized protein LOC112342306 [Selaginella moellendorffii]